MPLVACFRRDCLCTWTETSWTGTSLRACGERTRWTRRETTSSWSAVRTTGPSEAPGTTETNSSWTSSSSGACSKPGRTLRRSVRVHQNTSITTLQLMVPLYLSESAIFLWSLSLLIGDFPKGIRNSVNSTNGSFIFERKRNFSLIFVATYWRFP